MCDNKRKRLFKIKIIVILFSICSIFYAIHEKPKRTKEQHYQVEIDPYDFRGKDVEKGIRDYYSIKEKYGKIENYELEFTEKKIGIFLKIERTVSKGDIKISVKNAGRNISSDMEWISLTFPEIYSVEYRIVCEDKTELKTKVYGENLQEYNGNFEVARDNDFLELGFNEVVIKDIATATIKGMERVNLSGMEMTPEEKKQYKALVDKYYYIAPDRVIRYYVTALKDKDKDREFELLYNGEDESSGIHNMTLEFF